MVVERSTANPLLVIVGPTATGKTEVSMLVAGSLPSEIVSADSMLIYRHMNIGTAKPGEAEMAAVRHHMVDIIDPDQPYSAAMYCRDAGLAIKEIWQKKLIPVVAGGTGLYLKSLLDGYNFSETCSDPELRKELARIVEMDGSEALHMMLHRVDPGSAARLHVNDARRIIRALEINLLTGRNVSDSAGKGQGLGVSGTLMYGLWMERALLYRRIEERVNRMMEKGLVEEVRDLVKMGYTPSLQSMQGLGYKEMLRYLAGDLTLPEAVELIKMNTRRFAKRQITWFKRDARISWIDMSVRTIRSAAQEIADAAEGVFKPASKEF